MSPSSLTDSVVDPRDVLQADLLAVCERLCSAGDEAALVNQFFADLLPIWQKRTRHEKQVAWTRKDRSRFIGPWMDSLALRAAGTGWGRSLRQSERRIKQWTGQSLRKLQGTVRGEAAFFAVLKAIIDDRLQRCDASYLMTLFAKNERANISKAERNELADLVDVLVQIWLET